MCTNLPISVQIQKLNPDTEKWFNLFRMPEADIETTLEYLKKMHPEDKFRTITGDLRVWGTS